MTTVGPPQPAGDQQLTENRLTGQPGSRYRVVGRSPAHHDFVDKVKGALHYAADWRLPGMLHGRIVRSQLPSARITGIDVSTARALPGVVAVLTAADVPSNRIVEMASGGLAELEVSMPVLATDRVRYLGEPVAVVAAVTQQIAAEAAELVSVDYEELPGVFDVESARADGAPRVHAGRSGAETSARRWPPPTWWWRASTGASTSSTPTSSPRPGWAGWRTAC